MRTSLHASRVVTNTGQPRRALQRPFTLLQNPTARNRVPWRPNVIGNQVRGAKSKATVELGGLPQGSVGGRGPLEETNDEGPTYPPVVQQAWNNMRKFENSVVLTRVGNFYEVRRSLG